MRQLRSVLAALLALIAGLALAGCGSPASSNGSDASGGPRDAGGSGPVTVFAAASLKGSFEEIAQQSGSDARFSFDGSSGLVEQIKQGAPADVLATADKRNMDKTVEAGLIEGDPVQFTTNTLVLITPADNPGHVTGVDDSLTSARVVICEKAVPCGGATEKALKAANVNLTPASEETSVTDVLGAVTSGEADAGFVYRSDAMKAGDSVRVIEIPGLEPNTYWIGVVKGAKNPDAAKAFIAEVTGTDGQAILNKHGFGG